MRLPPPAVALVLVTVGLGAANADWKMESIVPRFDVEPSMPVAYKGGYKTDNSGNVSYGTEGGWTGMPACTGAWIGPVTVSLPSSSRHLTIGLNATSGFAVVEQANGVQVVHEEWRCTTGAHAAPLTCGSDPTHLGLAAYSALPATPPATYRALTAGWTPLAPNFGGRSGFSIQSFALSLDARVDSARSVEAFPSPGLPFTGRVTWVPTPGSTVELNSDDYLLGNRLCNGAYQVGIGSLRYSPTEESPMQVGTTKTSGAPIAGVVPLRPLDPIGDWGITIQGCNGEC